MKGKPKKIRVVVRLRPFLANEESAKNKRCISVEAEDGEACVLLQNSFRDDLDLTKFRFDGCYGESQAFDDLYQQEVQPSLQPILKGVNASVFCYGMSGSGKTHTMRAIVPRIVQDLIDSVQDAEVSMSCMELYNERLYDLLHPSEAKKVEKSWGQTRGESKVRMGGTEVPLRENSDGQVVIPNLVQVPVNSLEEFQRAYDASAKVRKTGSTGINSVSSRSHFLVTLQVVQRFQSRSVTARLHLVDLAGNEDNRYSGNKGKSQRMVESSSINQSLFVLSKVVNALNRHEARIPYRDSKLTRLLQDSLGGNSYATMICTVAPGWRFQAATARTLSFAQKGQRIVNAPQQNRENVAQNGQSEKCSKDDMEERLRDWRKAHGKEVEKRPRSRSHKKSSGKRRSKRPPVEEAREEVFTQAQVLGMLDGLVSDMKLIKSRVMGFEQGSLPQARRSGDRAVKATTEEHRAAEATTEEHRPADVPTEAVEGVTHEAKRRRIRRGAIPTDPPTDAPPNTPLTTNAPSNTNPTTRRSRRHMRTRSTTEEERIGETCEESAEGDEAESGADRGDRKVRELSRVALEVLAELNSGTAIDLTKLHRIGKKRAELIVNVRKQQGQFTTLRSLLLHVFCGSERLYDAFLRCNVHMRMQIKIGSDTVSSRYL